MSTEKYIKDLLERYKNGTCTPEEINLLESWFRQQESENPDLLTDADEGRLLLRLKEHPRYREPASVIDHPLKRFFRRSAAVWIGLFLLAGALVTYFVANNRSGGSQEQLAFREDSTGLGEHRRLVLPDSSVVWLNSRSKIAWHPDFRRHREIRLDGEAFFEVAHDAEHPFTVQAGIALARVYGTAFNIQAYDQTDELRIALQRGSIGVSFDSAGIAGEKMLTPGKLLIYRGNNKEMEIIKENPQIMGAWVSGKLIFNRTPLKDALAQLGKQYNAKFHYQPSLKNVSVTAQFDHPSLWQVLDHLSFGWDIQFTRKGDSIYVQ